MAYEKIKLILKEKTGLNPDSISKDTFNEIIKSEFIRTNCSNEFAYCEFIGSNFFEFQNLIDKLFIYHNHFFQDNHRFELLKKYIDKLLKNISKNQKLRILSIPCSNGEEIYSITISLLEAGFEPDQFIIDAVDINSSTVENARHAVFDYDSFDNNSEYLRNKYFRKAEDIYILNPKVANLVNFYCYNIISEVNRINSKYDLIFCKNILKYLDKNYWTLLINNLNRILVKNGILISSDMESSQFLNYNFTVYDKGIPNVCSKIEIDSPLKLVENPYNKIRFMDKIRNFSSYLSPKRSLDIDIEDKGTNSIILNNNDNLNYIQKLFFQNKIEQAVELCYNYIQNHDSDPNAYYLLATIYETTNNIDKAEEFFHKALYIEPYHYDSLVRLTLLFEKKGWNDRADMLRKRIDKITGKQ